MSAAKVKCGGYATVKITIIIPIDSATKYMWKAKCNKFGSKCSCTICLLEATRIVCDCEKLRNLQCQIGILEIFWVLIQQKSENYPYRINNKRLPYIILYRVNAMKPLHNKSILDLVSFGNFHSNDKDETLLALLPMLQHKKKTLSLVQACHFDSNEFLITP